MSCIDCKDRKVGCHSNCEKYKKFKKYRNNILEKRKEEQKKRGFSF